MRLSNFILDNSETILAEWEKFAESLVSKEMPKMDQAMLRDHARQMLETIAADLALPETALEQSEKSKGHHLPPLIQSQSAAATHGAQRWESGFSLNAAVSEYRALRASVTRLWEQAHGSKPLPKMAVDDLIRFNEAIDQAVSESVSSYYFEKEQQTRVFDTILSTSPDLGCTFDTDGRFIYANKALTELLGLPLNTIVGKNYHDLGLSNAADMQEKIQRVVSTNEQTRGEVYYRGVSGQGGYYEYICAPVRRRDGAVEAIACTARNITERKAAEDRNWQKANYDLLTGLPNRRLFRDRLEQGIKHAARVGAPIALLFVDLDYFKETNDQFGHEAGDLLLKLAAERIRSCVREADTVARLGGDEFTVILQDWVDTSHIEVVAGKILQELASPFPIFENVLQISGSVGIALFPRDADTLGQIFKHADQAMYAAKKAGRNCYRIFSPDMEDATAEHFPLIADLGLALPRKQFAVYYQPILDMRDGRIIKAEALLRWFHPSLGLMLPGQFIGSAEEAGLMHEIGNWVFAEAASHARRWSDLTGAPFQISINLSAAQFFAHADRSSWEEHIKTFGLPWHCIAIDLKEEVLLYGSTAIGGNIAGLHAAGMQLTIERFGIGYASVACLKKFAVDFIKIDPSLVDTLAMDANSRAITEAIIAMAHKLGLKVVAQGIETQQQRDCLAAAGCDYAQGYLTGAPLQPEEFEKLLHA